MLRRFISIVATTVHWLVFSGFLIYVTFIISDYAFLLHEFETTIPKSHIFRIFRNLGVYMLVFYAPVWVFKAFFLRNPSFFPWGRVRAD